jgi:hypothetical protein
VQRKIFYFVDKFKSLFKGYFQLHDKCELNGSVVSESDYKCLSNLMGQLHQLMKEQEDFKQQVVKRFLASNQGSLMSGGQVGNGS